jgi:tetratricopeptide (TPR) repeat protein
MNLITAKCPDCGAGLKIPEGSSSVICEFCGSQVMVTDVLGTGAVMQNCMILAYAALKNENYEEAFDHFNRALEIDMKSSSALFGRALCTGWLGKVAKPGFDDMMDMFEKAINYAPADKQANVKKNAAGEAVKSVRHLIPNIKFGVQMIELEMDAKDADFAASTADITANIKNTKEQITRALQKALEYDPSNKEIAPLMAEINAITVTAAKPLPGINLQIHENFSKADAELKTIDSQTQSPQQTQQVKSKSGCMGVFAILAFLAIAIAVVSQL